MLNRRRWLQIGATLGAASTLLLSPLRVLAAGRDGFAAETPDAAIKALLGDGTAEESDLVKLKVPDIAENGAVVPISVSTEIAGVTAISIMIDNNPNPLTGRFELSSDVLADVSTRVKMGESSMVRVFVEAPDKVYTAAKEVKVTIGGCGG